MQSGQWHVVVRHPAVGLSLDGLEMCCHLCFKQIVECLDLGRQRLALVSANNVSTSQSRQSHIYDAI